MPPPVRELTGQMRPSVSTGFPPKCECIIFFMCEISVYVFADRHGLETAAFLSVVHFVNGQFRVLKVDLKRTSDCYLILYSDVFNGETGS